jgi:hypothetical protein
MKTLTFRKLGFAALALEASLVAAATVNTADSPQYRQDATQMVLLMDAPRDTKCTRRKIVKTESIESKSAVERWTLDRCGKLVNYRVRFTPNSKGGTDLDVQLEK